MEIKSRTLDRKTGTTYVTDPSCKNVKRTSVAMCVLTFLLINMVRT